MLPAQPSVQYGPHGRHIIDEDRCSTADTEFARYLQLANVVG